MSPLSIAAMTGVPDKAEESVRSGWGAIFGCGWRRYAKVGHLVGRSLFGKSGQSARVPLPDVGKGRGESGGGAAHLTAVPPRCCFVTQIFLLALMIYFAFATRLTSIMVTRLLLVRVLQLSVHIFNVLLLDITQAVHLQL